MLGSLIVLQLNVKYTRNLKWKHLFKCFCGTEFVAIGADVASGRTLSCGCYNRHQAKKRFTKHGLNKTPEHRAWVEMRRRCTDNTRPGWKNYGGRGITVCARWKHFANFLVDMGPKPASNYSLDRIDNDGNYSPDNCRWADKKTQSRNQRRFKSKLWE